MYKKVLYVAIAVVLGGGGLVAAAEASQPGDALYPVKVNVTEGVVSALSLSDSSRANWEVERIQRRLTETEQLASDGKLTDETRTQITEQISKHVDDAQALADELNQSGDVNDVADLDKRLEDVKDHFDGALKSLDLNREDLKLHDEDESEAESADQKDAEDVYATEAEKVEGTEAEEADTEEAEDVDQKDAEEVDEKGTEVEEESESEGDRAVESSSTSVGERESEESAD